MYLPKVLILSHLTPVLISCTNLRKPITTVVLLSLLCPRLTLILTLLPLPFHCLLAFHPFYPSHLPFTHPRRTIPPVPSSPQDALPSVIPGVLPPLPVPPSLHPPLPTPIVLSHLSHLPPRRSHLRNTRRSAHSTRPTIPLPTSTHPRRTIPPAPPSPPGRSSLHNTPSRTPHAPPSYASNPPLNNKPSTLIMGDSNTKYSRAP